jgi:hypothetical protein
MNYEFKIKNDEPPCDSKFRTQNSELFQTVRYEWHQS